MTDSRISRRAYEQLKAAMPNGNIQWSEPNRTAAEQVLALSGTVEIATPGKDDVRLIKSADALPKEFFQVRRITLKGIKQSPQDLFNTLTYLRFHEFDRLESIDLSGTDVSLNRFSEPISGLKELTLVGCPQFGACLPAIAKQVDLKRLFIDNNGSLGDWSWYQNPQLEELSIANTGLNDQWLTTIAKLPKLKRLVLDDNPVLGGGLAHLHNQPELIDLSLHCPSIADLLAKNLSELKRLKRLSLVGANLTDAGIRHLERLTNLTALDLRKTKISAAGIERLYQALPGCRIDWDGGVIEPTKE